MFLSDVKLGGIGRGVAFYVYFTLMGILLKKSLF